LNIGLVTHIPDILAIRTFDSFKNIEMFYFINILYFDLYDWHEIGFFDDVDFANLIKLLNNSSGP